MCVRVRVCVHARIQVCACVCLRVYECVRVHVYKNSTQVVCKFVLAH